MKILLIDDDELVRAMLTQLLTQHGYEVRTAEDGNVGMRKLRSFAPDLVITDIVMPEKEGIETIMEITKLFPDLPVIAISGGARIAPEYCLKLAQKLGAAHVFKKPFDHKDFLAGVSQCLTVSEA